MALTNQRFSQSEMIINFTIENDPDRFVAITHWLMATLDVNDRQPTEGKTNAIV
ncbi:hypothetical protein D3C72_2318730 [compost metagenome]